MQDSDIESTILTDLAESGPYSIDQLRERLPGCTWEQVFSAVCRLSRGGRLTLRQTLSFDYSVSLGKKRTASRNAGQWAGDQGEQRSPFDGAKADGRRATFKDQRLEKNASIGRSKGDGTRKAGARR